ncbi:hypothetical protein FPHOBKDP_00153 [Listeria phage LPJP1]|nr:hypothetical protein FPHOBKDP_00153 [Listeria phage LPJP1]
MAYNIDNVRETKAKVLRTAINSLIARYYESNDPNTALEYLETAAKMEEFVENDNYNYLLDYNMKSTHLVRRVTSIDTNLNKSETNVGKQKIRCMYEREKSAYIYNIKNKKVESVYRNNKNISKINKPNFNEDDIALMRKILDSEEGSAIHRNLIGSYVYNHRIGKCGVIVGITKAHMYYTLSDKHNNTKTNDTKFVVRYLDNTMNNKQTSIGIWRATKCSFSKEISDFATYYTSSESTEEYDKEYVINSMNRLYEIEKNYTHKFFDTGLKI